MRPFQLSEARGLGWVAEWLSGWWVADGLGWNGRSKWSMLMRSEKMTQMKGRLTQTLPQKNYFSMGGEPNYAAVRIFLRNCGHWKRTWVLALSILLQHQVLDAGCAKQANCNKKQWISAKFNLKRMSWDPASPPFIWFGDPLARCTMRSKEPRHCPSWWFCLPTVAPGTTLIMSAMSAGSPCQLTVDPLTTNHHVLHWQQVGEHRVVKSNDVIQPADSAGIHVEKICHLAMAMAALDLKPSIIQNNLKLWHTFKDSEFWAKVCCGFFGTQLAGPGPVCIHHVVDHQSFCWYLVLRSLCFSPLDCWILVCFHWKIDAAHI